MGVVCHGTWRTLTDTPGTLTFLASSAWHEGDRTTRLDPSDFLPKDLDSVLRGLSGFYLLREGKSEQEPRGGPGLGGEEKAALRG